MKDANRRRSLFIFLSFVLSIVLFLFVLGLSELVFSNFPRPAFVTISPPYRKLYPSLSSKSSESLETHLAVHLPKPKYENLNTQELYRFETDGYALNVDLPTGINKPDAEVGSLAHPGRWPSRATSDAGEVAYEVIYGIDAFGRRETVRAKPKRGDRALVFLGCSFTFGVGLNDHETLPSAVAGRLDHHAVYNYAYFGWGPANTLRRISKPDFRREILEPKAVAIYTFTDSQMSRIVGNMGLTRMVPNWRSVLPYYFLDDQNRLHSAGMLSDGRPLQTMFFNFLAKSSLLNYFKIDLPLRYRASDFRLFAAILKEIERKLTQELGFEDFYVMFYPEQGLSARMIDELDKIKIKSIDYSEVIWPAYARPAHIPLEEVHPTAAAQDFMAEQLLRDLGLNQKSI